MNRIFDFENNKIEELTLDELRLTYKENDIYNKPLKGFYHYEVIDSIEELVNRSGLKYNIQQLFAATELYKPQLMEIPNIMSQNLAMVDFLKVNYLN